MKVFKMTKVTKKTEMVVAAANTKDAGRLPQGVIEQRLEKVMDWQMTLTVPELHRKIMKSWGVNNRSARRYVSKATDIFNERCKERNATIWNEHIDYAKQAYIKAYEKYCKTIDNRRSTSNDVLNITKALIMTSNDLAKRAGTDFEIHAPQMVSVNATQVDKQKIDNVINNIFLAATTGQIPQDDEV